MALAKLLLKELRLLEDLARCVSDSGVYYFILRKDAYIHMYSVNISANFSPKKVTWQEQE